MALINQNPSFLMIRFTLGFPASGDDEGPAEAWIYLANRNGSNLHLDPLRLRQGDLVGEWYFEVEARDVVTRFYWRPRRDLGMIGVVLPDVDGRLQLTLGEIARSPDQIQDRYRMDQFVLTGGSIPIRIQNPPDFFVTILEKLWPTRSAAGITRLRCEPSGLHLQGLLPSSFFAGPATGPGVPDAQRSVVLRLPRDARDFARSDGSSGPGARPFWALTSHPFPDAPNSSLTHITKWTEAMRSFRLDAAGRAGTTFIHSAVPTPDENCLVGVFGLDGPAGKRGLNWFSRSIGVRMNLGGGKVSQATFTPERLLGRAPTDADDWSARFFSPPTTTDESAPSSTTTLTLLRAEDRAVLDVTGRLQPISNAAVPVVASDDAGIPPSHRFWICAESGWVALEADAPQAVIDAGKDTEGAIQGVLELDKLDQALTKDGKVDARRELEVDAKARSSGSITIEMTGRAASVNTSGTVARLRLEVVDPFLTVTTQPVFYRPPAPPRSDALKKTPTPVLPALTVGTRAPVTGDAAPEDPQAAAAQLERTLASERFRSVVFASENVLHDPAHSGALRVTLKTDGDVLLEVDSKAIVVWQRPESLPLAQTYPLDPDQDLGGFLDANRGLLPFRPRTDAQVALRFSREGLPRLTDDLLTLTEEKSGRADVDPAWRLSDASGRGGSTAYFLPTLPGLEFDPTPAIQDAAKPPRWIYRHAPPVLDEAYATAAEARRDPTSEARSDLRAPQVGDLPPGFDPTRVEGSDAFTFGVAFSPEALGWLSRTDTNQTGSLALSEATASLAGRLPEITVKLSSVGGGEVQASFSRESNPEGLSARLRVQPPPKGATDLPSFAVGLAPEGEPTAPAYDDHLRHGGLPLLAARVGGRVLTHDAMGTRREEPDPSAPDVAKVRTLKANAVTKRVNLHAELIASNMVLEILGVDLEENGSGGSGSLRQSWELHDGAGRPARLAGFPLRPIRLTGFKREGGLLKVAFQVAVELVDPRKTTHIPSDARSPIATPGEGLLELVWTRSAAQEDDPWRIQSASGSLDWRFRAQEPGLVPLVSRLTAEFRETPADVNAEWPIVLTGLELLTPPGPLVLDDLNVDAELKDSTFLTKAAVDAAAGETIHINSFTLKRSMLERRPLPAWPVRLESRLVWSKPSTEGLSWKLRLALGQQDLPDGWSLEVKRGTELLIDEALEGGLAAPGRLILRTPDESEDCDRRRSSSFPRMPANSWFQRRKRDSVIVAACFRKAEELASLTAHVLLELVPDADVAGLSGELAARLTLESSGSASKQSLSASGWLKFPNQIPLKIGSTAVAHTATLIFRAAPWSIDAVFLGRGPALDDQDFTVTVEHEITFETHSARWQVLQPIRPRRIDAFLTSYTSATNDERPERLILDLGWVWWMRIPATPEPDDRGGGLALDSPHLENRWNFRARPAARGRFHDQPSYVVRLPFGFAGVGGLPKGFPPITLTTNADDERPVVSSGAPAGPTIASIRSRSKPEPEISPVYDRGGPETSWLEPLATASYFGEADLTHGTTTKIRPLLPAYPNANANGASTTKLPSKIGDWAWLIAALRARTSSEPLRLSAASLRTPYIPRSTPLPLSGSALVELPVLFFKAMVKPDEDEGKPDEDETDRVPFPLAPNRIDVQLLGFVGGRLRPIRQAGLEPTKPTLDDASRAATALQWGVEAVAAGRRDEAAIVVRDFAALQIVPRPFATVRSERPEWPSSPIAADPGGRTAPPRYERDEKCRPPALADAVERVVMAPTDATNVRAPEYFVFAARPEIPPPALKTRSVAATRIRMALSGLDGQPGTHPGRLAPARRSEVAADEDRFLRNGSLAGWTKSEDVSFTVCTTTGRLERDVHPSPGAGPHARRDPIPRQWDGAGVVVTISPPLVDVVVWARRPGETTRSTIAGYRAGFPEPMDADRLLHDVPALGQDVVLRRPRAKAGPYEQVTIDPTFVQKILGGRLQYSRLRLTQTLDATDPPGSEEFYLVIAAKSDVFRSSSDFATAASKPAILRLKDGKIEPFSLFLVAHADFQPGRNFGNGVPMLRTVVSVQNSPDRPDAVTTPNGETTPPAVDGEPDTVDPRGLSRVVLFDLDLPAPADPAYLRLFDDVRVLDVLDWLKSHKPTVLEKLKTTLAHTGVGGSTIGTLYLASATYVRAKDDPAVTAWTAPGSVSNVAQIARITSANEFVKPKTALALLHAPRTPKHEEPLDSTYRLAGFGRLDDDDFGPIQAVESSPVDDEATLVGWARVANLQSLERLSQAAGRRSVAPDATPQDASAFVYDVVFYGPGGELVPTKFSRGDR